MNRVLPGCATAHGRWPWFWLLGAPATVVGLLFWWHNVFAVFAVYQIGFCLLLPAVCNILIRRFSLAAHLEFLGLTGPGTSRGLLLGLGLGGALGGGTILMFQWFGGFFLADQDIPTVMAGWGVTRANLALLFWFMTLVNAPAEELYWRGFVHTELAENRPRRATILLIAACYASYHGVTVYLLVPNFPAAMLFMTAILAAGCFWGWLREKTGSVWPALISHAGAAGAYMVVARPMMEF